MNVVIPTQTDAGRDADRAAHEMFIKNGQELIARQRGKSSYEEVEAEDRARDKARNDFIESCPYAFPWQKNEKLVCNGAHRSKSYICCKCAEKGKYQRKSDKRIDKILAVAFSYKTYV